MGQIIAEPTQLIRWLTISFFLVVHAHSLPFYIMFSYYRSVNTKVSVILNLNTVLINYQKTDHKL